MQVSILVFSDPVLPTLVGPVERRYSCDNCSMPLLPAFRLGLRYGLVLAAIGTFHLWFSTMTPVPRPTWALLQSFFGVAIILFAGWAGLQAFLLLRTIPAAALAGGICGAVGVGAFTVMLFAFAYAWTDRLVQFPFASEDLTLPGKSIAGYLASSKGFKDLWTSSVGSAISMIPMAAGFGGVGALIVRSIDSIKEQGK